MTFVLISSDFQMMLQAIGVDPLFDSFQNKG